MLAADVFNYSQCVEYVGNIMFQKKKLERPMLLKSCRESAQLGLVKAPCNNLAANEDEVVHGSVLSAPPPRGCRRKSNER